MYESRLPQFFTDDSSESSMARALLEKYGIEVTEWRNDPLEPGMKPPIIHSGDGSFSGLDGIKSYIELKCDLDDPL